MKRCIPLLLALLLLFSAAGCGQEMPQTPEESESPPPTATPAPTPSPTPKPTPSPSPKPVPAEESEVYRNPFNGEVLDAPLTDRPFVVMINNLDAAFPHHGVGSADIIYEVLVESGITRMLALFSDIQSADKLMAIRSIRPYYLDLGLSYDAVICHAGGSDAAYSRIYGERLNNIDGVRGSGYGLTVFERDPDRVNRGIGLEHTMFTTGERLYQAAVAKNYRLTVDEDYDSGLRFTEDGAPAGGEDANELVVRFGNTAYSKTTTFTYDEERGTYTAVEYGMDYIDGNTGEPVEFRNVLAICAPTQGIDGYDHQAIDLFGEGEGWFACGGKYVPIVWEHAEKDEPFRYYYLENGVELELGAGRSYIGILPTGRGGVDFQ